jgi:hypothetical protein
MKNLRSKLVADGLLEARMFDQMGRPANLTKDQISQLQNAGIAPSPENLILKDRKTAISVPPYGLVVLVVHKQ